MSDLFEAERTIPEPKKPHKGCTCNCRADINGNIPGSEAAETRFIIDTATAHNCAEASKAAKRVATKRLGARPKHMDCRCSE